MRLKRSDAVKMLARALQNTRNVDTLQRAEELLDYVENQLGMNRHYTNSLACLQESALYGVSKMPVSGWEPEDET